MRQRLSHIVYSTAIMYLLFQLYDLVNMPVRQQSTSDQSAVVQEQPDDSIP